MIPDLSIIKHKVALVWAALLYPNYGILLQLVDHDAWN